MRSLAIASSAFALVTVLAACASESTQPLPRRGGTTQNPGTNTGGGEDDTKPPTNGNTTPPDPGQTVGTETWADGKQIKENMTIGAGATVDIPAGATVTVSPNVSITVKGTLKVTAGASHAKLTGSNWGGLVIASGGKLDADGLDIENAAKAIWTETGNADAKLTNGIIKGGQAFLMKPGSKLAIVKTKVTATAQADIAGTFTASYMDYDKTTAEGLTLSDPAGSMTISDSTLHGAGGGDYVIASGGKLVKLEYTTISGSHCGLHFNAVDQYILDHVSVDQNSWGAMLYGSGAGPNQIMYSNVRNTTKDLEMLNTNGPLTISNSFTGGKNVLQQSATVTNAANSPIANAKPRSGT
jgi:hypothetical protein